MAKVELRPETVRMAEANHLGERKIKGLPGVIPRGNARDQPAISAAMKASSQPAYLRLPFRLAFSVASARARLSAILRSSARLRAALRSRTRLASSRKV